MRIFVRIGRGWLQIWVCDLARRYPDDEMSELIYIAWAFRGFPHPATMARSGLGATPPLLGPISNEVSTKRCWLAAMKEVGRPIPPPSVELAEGYSGKWQLRAPKSLHRRRAKRAKCEGVSLDTLAVTLLAEGLSGRTAHER